MDSRKTRRAMYGIFLILFLYVVGGNTWMYVRGQNTELGVAFERREAAAKFAAMIVKERFGRLTDIALSLSTRAVLPPLISKGKWDEAIDVVKNIPSDFPYIERVFLSDPKGTLMADAPALAGVRGKNFADRDWYKGVMASSKPYVSEVYKRSAEPRLNVVAVAAPIVDKDGGVLGILVLQINIETLLKWSREIFFGTGAGVTFIDQNGHAGAGVGIDAQAEIVDVRDLSAHLELAAALSGGYGARIVFDDIENEKKIMASAPVEGYDWTVIVEQPTRIALQIYARETKGNLLIQLVVLLVFVGCMGTLITIVRQLSLYRQRENAFLQSAGDGLVAIDKDWNIILWNPAATSITGWDRDKAIGKPLRQIVKFVRARDRTENVLFISEAMLSGKVSHMTNHTIIVRKDGGEVSVGDSAAPIFDEDGKVIGAIIVFRDVTKVRETTSIHSSFAYAHHQMRTPVTEAMWNIELALEECTKEETCVKLREALNSMRSVRKLVMGLTDVSEIDQHMIVPRSEEVAVTAVIDEALKAVERKAGISDVRVIVEPMSAAAAIRTDRKLLVRVLSELLDNAISYSRQKGEVRLRFSTGGRDRVFEVQDGGSGIPPEQQGIVFTKFFRGHNIPPESVGAGLGLYLSSAYVNLLGGKIWFKSAPGSGTTFYVSLPVVGE